MASSYQKKFLKEFEAFFDNLPTPFSKQKTTLLPQLIQVLELDKTTIQNKNLKKFYSLLAGLPFVKEATEINLDEEAIKVKGVIKAEDKQQIQNNLLKFNPWRKGPFNIFDIFIDSEWRCNLKWDRLKNATDFQNKIILDVGCANGYYAYKFVTAGAREVVGIDPSLLSFFQFKALNTYVKNKNIAFLPLKLEDFPKVNSDYGYFDIAVSMGVLYHQKSPFEHLLDLKRQLKKDGVLILETLIIEQGQILVPTTTYAKMNNVWFIPTINELTQWLKKVGFKNIEVIAATKIINHEQRATEWMTFESLDDFLAPDDATKTIEGHPAPVRALLKAQN